MKTAKRHPLYRAYYYQTKAAERRKDRNGTQIEMRLSFDEWLSIWESSGHLSDRGKGCGKYVMSRINDLGHYEIGNVCIKAHMDNILEGIANSQLGNSLKTPKEPKTSTNRKSVMHYKYTYDLSLRPAKYLRKHSLTDEQILEIISRYESLETWDSISKDYNVSRDTIRQTIYQIKLSR